MKGFDLVVLICTSLLIAKGMWKGFIKEIAGIIAVLLAVVLSFSLHDKAMHLTRQINLLEVHEYDKLIEESHGMGNENI